MSRATRAARLLWREWWYDDGRDWAAGLLFLLVFTGAIFGIGSLVRPHVPDLANQPRVAVGFLVLVAPIFALSLLIVVVDRSIKAYRALRSAWERAGRDG